MANLFRLLGLGLLVSAFAAVPTGKACVEFSQPGAVPGASTGDVGCADPASPASSAPAGARPPWKNPPTRKDGGSSLPILVLPIPVPVEDWTFFPLPFPGGCFNCGILPSNDRTLSRSLLRSHAFIERRH